VQDVSIGCKIQLRDCASWETFLHMETPLLAFAVGNVSAEHTDRVLAEVETEAEKVLGRFRAKEHDALRMAII
jgi:hypothetical protein